MLWGGYNSIVVGKYLISRVVQREVFFILIVWIVLFEDYLCCTEKIMLFNRANGKFQLIDGYGLDFNC